MDEFSTLLQEIRFSERFRGYDPDEVDAYVHTVAKAAAQMQGRLRELQERVEAAESRVGSGGVGGETEETLTRTLLLAQRTADAAVAEAEAEAARMLTDAEERSGTVVTEAEERATVLLSAAQSQASALMADADAAASSRLRDAQDRSARMLAEAETDRRRILAEAEAEAASAALAQRDRALAEVTELDARRSVLQADIEALERHVSDQRSQLKRALAALRSLIEDPANFGLTEETVVPAPVEVGSSPAPDAQLTDVRPEHDVVGETDVVDLTDPSSPPPPPVGAGTDLTGTREAEKVAAETDVTGTDPTDAISDEFAAEVPPPSDDEAPVMSLPLIDDFEHPDVVVEGLAGDTVAASRAELDESEELAVEFPLSDDEVDVEEPIPPVPSFDSTVGPDETPGEATHTIDGAAVGAESAVEEPVEAVLVEGDEEPVEAVLVEGDEEPVEAVVVNDAEAVIDLVPEGDEAVIDLVAEGDEAVIDLVAEGDEAVIDPSLERPVDAEVVPESEPRQTPPPSGETPPGTDLRTAPPRFVTAADLDSSAEAVTDGIEADEIELDTVEVDTEARDAFEAEAFLAGSEDSVVETRSEPEVVETEPGAERKPDLIDFDEIESQPITQPVPVVEPEHPSLFVSEPTADEAFLAQLREAVSADDQPLSDEADDEALSAFFEEEDEERTRGWFGRKR
jgi:DivIVA domain-containing protein